MTDTEQTNPMMLEKNLEKPKNVTMNGLHKWYEAEFEKLGWMILSLEKQNTTKFDFYKKTIEHLKNALVDKKGKVREEDRKDDLQIMIDNVNKLQMYLNTINTNQFGGKRKSRKGSKKGSKKGSRKGSRKGSMKGGKRGSKKGSKKGSKRTSRKSSRKRT